MTSETLKLGVAEVIITPKVGGRLFGYTPDLYSNSVHDDLTLTAFYFEDGKVRALMLSATVCLMETAVCEELAARIEAAYGIPKEHCLIHATHTHSGPAMRNMPGWGDLDREYYETVFLPSVMSCVGEAMKNITSVRVGIATGKSLIGVNRRELLLDNTVRLGQNPWGPFNPNMTVISFRDLDGRNVATMVHYGMHGTCAGENKEISRDWAGVMTDALKEEGGGTVAFFNGPEGDVGPRLTNGDTTGHGEIRYVERHGALAAQDAVAIYRSIREWTDAGLSVLAGSLSLPLDKRIDRATAEKGYETYKGKTVNLSGGRAKYYEEQLRLYEEGYVDQAFLEIPQTVLSIGSVAFASTPYELFSEIGMRIAEASPIPYTLVLSNTNGSMGYLVTEDQICRGGYEVKMFKTGFRQPYADNADWHMVTGTLENLKKLKGE